MNDEFEEYGVLEGLKHMRYDYEDPRAFMIRVMPTLIQMRSEAMAKLYEWQNPYKY